MFFILTANPWVGMDLLDVHEVYHNTLHILLDRAPISGIFFLIY